MKYLLVYLHMLRRFFNYYRKAITRYDVHSPFVAQLEKAIFRDHRHFYVFSHAQTLRETLLRNRNTVNIVDYGAGSMVDQSDVRSIRSIAKHSPIGPRAGKILFRLVQFSRPSNIFELGTSLGISTLYLAGGALNSRVLTVEGNPEVSEIAENNLHQLEHFHVEFAVGRFSEVIKNRLPEIDQLDFLYLDGDHRPGASLEYLQQLMEKATEESVFVIADIHWSDEMETAWEKIKEHPAVTLSVDVYYFGFLFFRKENREKEHYTLIQSYWKPWRIGLFAGKENEQKAIGNGQ